MCQMVGFRLSGDHSRGPFGGPGRLRNALNVLRFAISSISANRFQSGACTFIEPVSRDSRRGGSLRKEAVGGSHWSSRREQHSREVPTRSFPRCSQQNEVATNSGTGGVLQEFFRTSTQAGSRSLSSQKIDGACEAMDQVNVVGIFRYRAAVMKTVPAWPFQKRDEGGVGGGDGQRGSNQKGERLEGFLDVATACFEVDRGECIHVTTRHSS